MLVVKQGEVAVIKAYVGLPTQDTSGDEFKFGSIVRPGHRGIWQEPLRTGKYPINPRCYQAEIVPTAILTLNWADASSQAHNLDAQLKQIVAKSREGFIFKIDLQVQIHVPDTQGAAGHLHGGHDAEPGQRGAAGGGRQPLPRQAAEHAAPCTFIETREQVQEAGAWPHHRADPQVPGGDARRLHPGRHAAGGARDAC